MENKDIDLMVYGASPDFQYLTGTLVEWRKHRDLNYPLDSVFVPQNGEPIILAGHGNYSKIEECWINEKRILERENDLNLIVKQIISDLDHPKIIGVGEYTWGSLVLALTNQRTIEKLKSAEGIMNGMRMLKDSSEKTKLRQVANLTDDVMEKIIDEIDENSTMRGLNLKIEHSGRSKGASDVSFPTTAGFCKSGTEPIGVFNYKLDQKLETGSSVAFDVGFVLNGYCSDWGRSMYYGKPEEHINKAYTALMMAVVETIDAMGDEVLHVNQVFDYIEMVCDREGYKNRLLERLPDRRVGHQIGIEVHEDPWLKPDEDQELVDDMVFCIEPKLWHKGEYYLRVEDMILIKNGKAESLTKYDRELFQL